MSPKSSADLRLIRTRRDIEDLAALYLVQYRSKYTAEHQARDEQWLRDQAARRRYRVLKKHVYVERRFLSRPTGERPVLSRLLVDAEAHDFGAVFLRSPEVLTDRMWEDSEQNGIVQRLKDAGCRVFSGRSKRHIDVLSPVLDKHWVEEPDLAREL